MTTKVRRYDDEEKSRKLVHQFGITLLGIVREDNKQMTAQGRTVQDLAGEDELIGNTECTMK